MGLRLRYVNPAEGGLVALAQRASKEEKAERLPLRGRMFLVILETDDALGKALGLINRLGGR